MMIDLVPARAAPDLDITSAVSTAVRGKRLGGSFGFSLPPFKLTAAISFSPIAKLTSVGT